MAGIHKNLSKEGILIVPPPTARFTLDNWHSNLRERYRFADDQHQLADRILEECKRVKEQTQEACIQNKNESNHCIEQRIKDIEFRKNETEKQRKEVFLEIDAQDLYKERILDAMASIEANGLRICRKCIILREARLGIDLVRDEVERELLKENELILGVLALVRVTLEQMNEQIRRLRSTTYFIDRDLENKMNALKIDKHNALLNESSLNLSMYHGSAPLDPSTVTIEEWDSITTKNFVSSGQEISSAIALRSYIDTILKQAVEDLNNQYNTVNAAFKSRIDATKEAKTKMEVKHNETVRQINETMRVITSLEKAIAEKEGFTALVHTRLGNRCQRADLELCKDAVEFRLVHEVQELRENVALLQQALAEAQASLRYLLKTQIQLEEDINIKMNTLKIDEVDCMTLRQSIVYNAY